MRKILLIVLCIATIATGFTQVNYKALAFSPQFPKQGKQLNFVIDAALLAVADKANIEVAVYLFTSKGVKVLEPVLERKATIYSGTVQLDTNSNCIAFGISDGEQKDNNLGKGFIIPIYNEHDQPLKEYYLSALQFNIGYGAYLFGMNNDPERGLAVLEEGMKAYPDAIKDESFLLSYLFASNSAKKKVTNPIILEQLEAIQNKPLIKETEYSLLIGWYSSLKQKTTADSFTALMKKQYPEGTWKKREMVSKIYSETNADKKKKLLDEYITAYPPKAEDIPMIQSLRAQLAEGYAASKNYPAFKEIADSLSPAEKYSIYNNLAWGLAEANENISWAKEMAKEATEWTKKEVNNPTEKKPDNLTKKAWEEKRKNDYAMYADTYAFILYNTGDYKEGLPFAKDAATISKLNDAELNERYALLLEKAAPPAEAKKIIEEMVTNGKASPKTKEALKNIYTGEHKTADGFENYLAGLEVAAKAKKRADITKSMINEPAPNFILKDFEGKEVSLASLKGKVVVVDFWATWCGPCIASMPAMKKAEEKLKPKGDVAFLFVDTWENVENKKKNAMDFMKKKNYPFYVLMDDENKVVGDFKVTGIPAKFIIDKTGNIRFKATGFSGNADEMVEELSLMVDLASK